MGTSILVGSRDIGRHSRSAENDVRRERLVEAIRACCAGRATQDELAERTGISQSTASNYLSGKSVPNALVLNAIERACDRPDGWISIRAGLVADVKTVPEAIAIDPDLTDVGRDALMDAYRAGVQQR